MQNICVESKLHIKQNKHCDKLKFDEFFVKNPRMKQYIY